MVVGGIAVWVYSVFFEASAIVFWIIAAVGLFCIATVVLVVVVICWLPIDHGKNEQSFRRIHGDLDSLLTTVRDIRMTLPHVQTMNLNIASQVARQH